MHRKKKCYEDGIGVIASSVEPMGVVGLSVDAVSGAIDKYDPRPPSSCARSRAAGRGLEARGSKPRADEAVADVVELVEVAVADGERAALARAALDLDLEA